MLGVVAGVALVVALLWWNPFSSPRVRALLTDAGLGAAPPSGRFSIQRVTGSSLLGTRTTLNGEGERVSFEVRYQGPKELAEIVLEHWEGPVRTRETVLWSQRFGAVVRTERGNVISYDEGPAFSQTLQRFTVWIDELPERYPDGRNALATVRVAAPTQMDAARIDKAIVDLWGSDVGRFGSETFPMPDETVDDDEVIELWSRTRFEQRGGGGFAPYPEGTWGDRLLFRVRD